MKQTPSQTVGPFYSIGLTDRAMNKLVTDSTPGQRIRIEGRIIDGDGKSVPDAMIEIWQANAAGRYNHPDDKQEKPLDQSFTGWGRSGRVPGSDESVQAPHINVVVFARGMLVHAFTRIYFSDEPANETDPVLNLIKKERQQTLIANRREESGKVVYRFDIRLQGENETVFFDM